MKSKTVTNGVYYLENDETHPSSTEHTGDIGLKDTLAKYEIW